ncbi:hypothetical protein Tco_0055156, partial [Tanacetum coccineum]
VILCLDIMADVNAPVKQAPAVAPPTRTDEQILPWIRWVPIGKSNYYLDAEKSQSILIYKIAVDILKQTNFFRAFTASSTIPAIYIQQFWDTICYDRIAGGYKCQLDEQWFNLTKDTLRILLSTLSTIWVIQNKLNTYLMSFCGASSIELISIMWKGCGKNSLNPSILSRKIKRIWHNIRRERRKPLLL